MPRVFPLHKLKCSYQHPDTNGYWCSKQLFFLFFFCRLLCNVHSSENRRQIETDEKFLEKKKNISIFKTNASIRLIYSLSNYFFSHAILFVLSIRFLDQVTLRMFLFLVGFRAEKRCFLNLSLSPSVSACLICYERTHGLRQNNFKYLVTALPIGGMMLLCTCFLLLDYLIYIFNSPVRYIFYPIHGSTAAHFPAPDPSNVGRNVNLHNC